MKYKAAIFDLDGTLIGTSPSYIHEVFNSTLREIGLSEVDAKVAERFWFSPNVNRFVRQFTWDIQSFWKAFKKYDTPQARLSASASYVDCGFLKELKAKNIKLGIATATPKQTADLEIGLLEPVKFDSVVYAQRDFGVKPKPDPDCLIRSLSNLDTSPEQAIFVGNGLEDIRAGHNARIKTFFLKRPGYPYNPSIPLEDRLDSLRDLARIFV
jgi:phosphoglycolate phosphatase-like HAD superfamily hydrolase